MSLYGVKRGILWKGGWFPRGVRGGYAVGVWKAIINEWEGIKNRSHFIIGMGEGLSLERFVPNTGWVDFRGGNRELAHVQSPTDFWKIFIHDSNERELLSLWSWMVMSDCMYNAGWTEDIRKIVDHLHCQYPEAPLFAVGTSIGANVLVKYLGEDGVNIPLVGAAAICSTWDLLICDRFINRKLVQKFYDKALTIGLQGYAQLYVWITFLWDLLAGINRSYLVLLIGKALKSHVLFETSTTMQPVSLENMRRCSSASFVGNVSVPLLCISTLDDPVCTREAIPWDECKANKNIILATTKHGGHLGFFEGLTAKSLWWVRAVDEFFNVLHSTEFIHRKRGAGMFTRLKN
ncbi:Embryogenesis-associated protein EMB8 [Vitis vinifera]|uniref:Embryogenesis-associated protein EMB8 n=1 Tax=Vitis vinifera TaxID=29760 RepID=A0A438GFI4_VITVI|nr:Embryogenesis-associated protein EMB8 [Vitis vinifera]